MKAVATQDSLWSSKIDIYRGAMLCEPSSIPQLHSNSTSHFRRFGQCLDCSVNTLETQFDLKSNLRFMGFAGKAATHVLVFTGLPMLLGLVVVPVSHGVMKANFFNDDDDITWNQFLFGLASNLVASLVWYVVRPLLSKLGGTTINLLRLLKSWRQTPRNSYWRVFVGTMVLAAAGFGLSSTTEATRYGVFKLALIRERYLARKVCDPVHAKFHSRIACRHL